MYVRWNLGVSFGYGVIKEKGRGGLVKSHGFVFFFFFLFCPFRKYLTRYMLQTSFVDENHHFLTYSVTRNSHVSTIFSENWFLLIFTYIFNASKLPRVHWLYEITVTSYEVQWYLFWYQWIEEVLTYTLVANIGVSGVSYRKSMEGVATISPLRRTWYKKYFRRTRVK